MKNRINRYIFYFGILVVGLCLVMEKKKTSFFPVREQAIQSWSPPNRTSQGNDLYYCAKQFPAFENYLRNQQR